MKKVFATLFCLCLCLIMINCKKSDGYVEYPSLGSHGPNLLHPADSVTVSILEIYSLAADLDKESEAIEVHLINLDTSVDTMQWRYEPNTINGWNIYPFDTITDLQKLSSFELNHIDVGIVFTEPGNFKIELFWAKQHTPIRSTIIKSLESNITK